MTDSSKPRKILAIKKTAANSPDIPAERRQRAGGRARQVAQQDRARSQQRAAPTREVPVEPAAPRAETSHKPVGSSRQREPRFETESFPHEHSTPDAVPADGRDRNEVTAPRVHRRPRPAAQAEIFPVFAPCPQGIEEALAAELQALGFDQVQTARAGCHFMADWTGIERANLYSRLATRILVQVAHGPAHHEDDILDLAYQTPWERWFGAEHSLRVDTSAIRSPMKSLQYCNLRAKDGICDRLRDREGARPDIDTVRPDARVHLFLSEDTATLYLDTSGESLFKRGWRLDKGSAPLRENLAAGLLALSGWDPSQPLLDPFCGSGTILIEAAWIALGVPAGIWRPFGFERLRDHDARHWRDIKDEARTHIAPQLESPLVGYDLDPQAIEAAQRNTERAWLTTDSIRFEVGDAREVAPPAESGWLITNPPYGERMAADEAGLWRAWSENLKRNYSGWEISIISSDLDLPQLLRLKPKRRYPLYNGALDCRMFSFEMVKAGYRKP
ncbi:THUMP domain-containing class I SAM-dependent RNA methyltransferase [Paralcaligenes ureilyticus]|uniref:Putative N6-adenine-specific DNA methylase n=1 Tax=Paralcaligenes ureilyticus TaxID=627131 RepID=A0A4R3M9V7_9BURK|nr:THUMP domain-containing protein [Paralcaligenes ureilyticus]TCT08557.1 putative N6-adenine-specific DNA methylase [Paralcaligenes ureilyticus]